jgi:hypothetical protein
MTPETPDRKSVLILNYIDKIFLHESSVTLGQARGAVFPE